MRVEVCADSILSIQNASDAKVDRIELCSALGIGGLTPSFGLIKEAVDVKLLPIHCLIRPRPGHFFYSKDEIKVIEKNILNARELGCHGVVVGAHDQNFKLDLTLLKRWKTLAGSMYITFHRAFDVLVSPLEAINQLIDLGFDCILTSGQKEKAEEIKRAREVKKEEIRKKQIEIQEEIKLGKERRADIKRFIRRIGINKIIYLQFIFI